mgnify:CR=1 FL=1
METILSWIMKLKMDIKLSQRILWWVLSLVLPKVIPIKMDWFSQLARREGKKWVNLLLGNLQGISLLELILSLSRIVKFTELFFGKKMGWGILNLPFPKQSVRLTRYFGVQIPPFYMLRLKNNKNSNFVSTIVQTITGIWKILYHSLKRVVVSL